MRPSIEQFEADYEGFARSLRRPKKQAQALCRAAYAMLKDNECTPENSRFAILRVHHDPSHGLNSPTFDLAARVFRLKECDPGWSWIELDNALEKIAPILMPNPLFERLTAALCVIGWQNSPLSYAAIAELLTKAIGTIDNEIPQCVTLAQADKLLQRCRQKLCEDLRRTCVDNRFLDRVVLYEDDIRDVARTIDCVRDWKRLDAATRFTGGRKGKDRYGWLRERWFCIRRRIVATMSLDELHERRSPE